MANIFLLSATPFFSPALRSLLFISQFLLFCLLYSIVLVGDLEKHDHEKCRIHEYYDEVEFEKSHRRR